MGRTQRGKSDTEPAVTERQAAAPARTGAWATLLPVLLTSLLWLVLAGAALLAWALATAGRVSGAGAASHGHPRSHHTHPGADPG